MKRHVLVVEDDVALARVIRDDLAYAGFEVQWADSGLRAVRAVQACAPDLVLLDLRLPDSDGFELCGVLRQGGRIPVIILTVRDQRADKLKGLALGADDYVTKPFDSEELVARIRAVLRRARPAIDRLVLGQVVVDFVGLRASRAGRDFHLTHREFELLRYLAERQGHRVSRDELLREIWGYFDIPNTRSVDHAISRLRRKVEVDAHSPRYLQTAHGDGYCLVLEDAAGR